MAFHLLGAGFWMKVWLSKTPPTTTLPFTWLPLALKPLLQCQWLCYPVNVMIEVMNLEQQPILPHYLDQHLLSFLHPLLHITHYPAPQMAERSWCECEINYFKLEKKLLFLEFILITRPSPCSKLFVKKTRFLKLIPSQYFLWVFRKEALEYLSSSVTKLGCPWKENYSSLLSFQIIWPKYRVCNLGNVVYRSNSKRHLCQ